MDRPVPSRSRWAGQFPLGSQWPGQFPLLLKRLIPLLLVAVIGLVPASAQAGVVVPTTALQAAEALSTQPSLVTGGSWVLQPTIVGETEIAPTVVIANTALLGFPTNGSQFLAFSSGFATHVESADQTEYNDGEFENAPGTTAHDEGSGVVNDLTILHVAINVPAGKNCLALDFRFLSQEYPQYVGEYDDGFLVELDADNWKIRSGSASFNAPANFATDSEGQPLSVNSTGTLALSPAGAAGSGFEGTLGEGGEAFGGGTALLSAETPVTAGTHNLYFSVFDAVDHALDSGAFVDHLRAFDASSCPRGAVPAGEAATPPAPVATASVPQVSGSPTVGDTLSATTGTFTGEELTYTYQWLLEGAPITNATSSTYVVTSPDIGKPLSVVVTATNTGGNVSETSASSEAVKAAVVAAPTATATLPLLSGSPTVGDTLKATTGTFTGEELTYTYQWLLEGAPITNATSSTYVLTNADTTHKLSVVVTATNSGGYANETSAQTAAVTPAAPLATATLPQLSGSTTVGDTLSASTGTFTGEELTYTYQWLLEGAPITNANSATYQLTNADTGHKLSVVVIAVNGGGNADETSSQTAFVTPAAPLATATLPQLSGSTVVGDTLSASTGTFTGEELLYTYQWLLEGAPITNATSATYQLTNADTGHKLSVVVTAYNGGGHANETSSLSATVTPAAPVATATLPQISGSPIAGDTLKATTGTFTGEEITYTYQWLLEGAPITGATGASYLLTNADVGHKLSVVVTATNGGGHANETSALTANVALAAPVATATLPQVGGSATVGDTLSATTGTFTGAELIYSYQWLREGTPIAGATSASYLLTDVDAAHKLSVVVTATNGGGHANETSAPTSNVIPVAPIATQEVPQISGSPVVGETLTATTGTVTGEELAYSYQWLLEGVPIAGATGASYVVTSADMGHKLSVRVTALNGGGEVTESSPLSATVTGAATLPLATIPVPELAAALAPQASTTSAGGPMPCRSTRVETIHWHTAGGVRLTHITITLNGKPYESLSGSSRHAAVSLVGRGPGEVLVRITGSTARGEHYGLGRVFHPCVSGVEPAQPPSLLLVRSDDL
jgi:hypothetical protein